MKKSFLYRLRLFFKALKIAKLHSRHYSRSLRETHKKWQDKTMNTVSPFADAYLTMMYTELVEQFFVMLAHQSAIYSFNHLVHPKSLVEFLRGLAVQDFPSHLSSDKNGSCIPLLMSEDGNPDVITDVIICTELSGGQGFVNNMPYMLTLRRIKSDGTSHETTYIQETI